MIFSGRRERLLAVAFTAALCWATPASAQAKDVEHRDYSVLVDGKEAGQSKLTIVVHDDGMTEVSGTATVNINMLLGKYSLAIESTERWKEGRLVSLKTNCTENGKKTEVQAAAQGEQLVVRVNGRDKNARGDSWTSSYWKLPDARFHNKAVPVLESDSGKELNGELKYIGAEKLTINGQQLECYHFRVTGIPSPIDLWYDRYHRMVRQEFVESGHRTIINLTSLRR
jgi:hypothetical protein